MGSSVASAITALQGNFVLDVGLVIGGIAGLVAVQIVAIKLLDLLGIEVHGPGQMIDGRFYSQDQLDEWDGILAERRARARYSEFLTDDEFEA